MSSRSTPAWVLALASVASLIVTMDALVVTTALGTIRVDLGASLEQLEWTINAYTLTFAVLMLTASALSDRFGRRRTLIAGLALFIGASAACAFAPAVGWLVAARAIQGTGAALVMPAALALLSAAYPSERRGWALGVFAGVTGLGVACGPIVGGAVTQAIGWQAIFWLNVPIGLVAIPLVRARVDESFGADTTLDLPGVALVTAAALGIVWGLVRANAAGWTSLEVLGSLAAGAILLAAFVAWELRAREAMVPMPLFASRIFSAGNGAMFCVMATMYGTVFFLAQFQQTALGNGPIESGLRLLPLTATLIVVAPLAGSLVDRLGERPLIVGGPLVLAAGMTWLAVIAKPGVGYAEMIAPMIVLSAGISAAIPAIQKAVIGAVAPRELGKASGILSTMRYLGGVFGVAVAVAVFAAAGSYASAEAFSDGFRSAIGVCAGLAVVGALCGAALPGGARRGRGRLCAVTD